MLTSRSREAEIELPAPRVRRDPQTSEELFAAHFEAVYRYFSRRVSSQEDAKDLAAETFAATLGAKVPKGVEPLSWLYGIARRKLVDHLRRTKRVSKPAPKQPDSRSAETAATLRAIIDSLPNLQREALLLQVLEGLSIREISHIMRRSEGSAKALIQRAKDKVRHESRIADEEMS